jgi:hypothetical protein
VAATTAATANATGPAAPTPGNNLMVSGPTPEASANNRAAAETCQQYLSHLLPRVHVAQQVAVGRVCCSRAGSCAHG